MKLAAAVLPTVLALAAAAGCVGRIGDDERSEAGGPGSESSIAAGASRLQRLTRVEYQRAVTAVLGADLVATVHFGDLPADGKVGRFESNVDLGMNIDSIDAYRSIAEEIGALAGANAADLLGCDESDACTEGFIQKYGKLLYRRPLSDKEVSIYEGLWTTARQDGPLEDAVRLMFTAMLQTPDFLYRLEKGAPGQAGDVRKLSGYEVAARLAFFLWRSGPDATLLDAAEHGALDTPEGVEAEARRLLADERADFTLLRFSTEWLGIDGLESQLVDATAFPEFEPLRADIIDETNDFILHWFRKDDAQIAKLFTADYSFASPALAAFYGKGVTSSGAGGEIFLDGAQRMGVLTQASFLTAHARTPSRAPIYRGKSILTDVFCRELHLPDGVNTAIKFNPTLPARKQIEDATSSQYCQSCHGQINPLGFLFENYDGVGKWRTTDAGSPVNASAKIVGTDVDGQFDGATSLAQKLAQSEQVASCVSRQWLRFALARTDAKLDEGSIEAMTKKAQGDTRELVVALATSDAFRYRRTVP